ncbi:hypothetical protein [Deinococcus planocerae]|uniref:hypothetical protein n=1 Tax=Deinococcus planocerae TaxID=1737569 RepID=UPI0011AF71C7|nr:hypothetical protein [Deinococcus planocerae]
MEFPGRHSRHLNRFRGAPDGWCRAPPGSMPGRCGVLSRPYGLAGDGQRLGVPMNAVAKTAAEPSERVKVGHAAEQGRDPVDQAAALASSTPCPDSPG